MAIPLNCIAHVEPKNFLWTLECDKAYWMLKVQLSQAPILIPLDWHQMLHVFIDALDCAIGSVLMWKSKQGWYHPIYYVSQ